MHSMRMVGRETFSTFTGVRQGASSSCPLFTFFIDSTIEAIESFGPDGWLGNLHTLLFMDDTVIFTTSRGNLHKKLFLLKECTDKLGMVIHPSKSQFMTVNGTDMQPFVLGNMSVAYTNTYTYLGTTISTETITKQVQRHVRAKASHVMKFTSFLTKNNEAPFSVKKAVWQGALNSAIFYSCETWLTPDLKTAESTYMSTLKQLIGVRASTCNDIVLVETGMANAKNYITQRQSRFLSRLRSRDDFQDSYIGKTIAMSIQQRTPSGRILQKLLDVGTSFDYISASQEATREAVRTSASSRRVAYARINTRLDLSYVYSAEASVSEATRIAYTRIHLASHRLKVETGRWSRTPLEDRTCPCGDGIQTEQHVLLTCPATENLRAQCPASQTCRNIGELLDMNQESVSDVCNLCLSVLRRMS